MSLTRQRPEVLLFRHTEGWQVSYLCAGSPAAVPMVLLHGIGGGAAAWSLQLEALASRFQVLAWDAPGYGMSSLVPTAQQADAPAYGQRLWQWLDGIGVRGPIHLVGQSLGCIVSAAAAALAPARVLTLTLLSPALGYGTAEESERAAKRAQRRDSVCAWGMAGLAQRRAPALLARPTPENVARVRDVMSRIPEAGYLAAVDLLMASDLRTHLAAVRAPVTVAAGRHDTITPYDQCKALAQDSHALFVTLGEAGHASYVEEPALVNALLASAA